MEDESTENMSDCWRTSIAFIRSAHAAGGKVLVQLWGRSRSASVVSYFDSSASSISLVCLLKLSLSDEVRSPRVTCFFFFFL